MKVYHQVVLWAQILSIIVCIDAHGLFSATAPSTTCGYGTHLNNDTLACQCNNALCSTREFNASKVHIAGLFDELGFDWGREIFDFTISLLNDHNNGWHDDILNDGTEIIATVADAGCDPGIAVPAYWDLKTSWGQPLHGVIGCRCSGASIAVSRIAGLEDIPVVSMSSSSAQLSDIIDFSSFFRLVGPDNSRGQVGALVTLLQSFGWDRVSVINTDTQYTKDLATAFGNTWTGDIAHIHTVSIRPDGTVEDTSVDQALDGVPVDDPRVNSRIIVLIAHHQHAYPILQRAQQRNFQPDTVWVGADAWTGQFFGSDTEWMPDIPGYIGVVPYRNNDSHLHDFLNRLQNHQKATQTTTPSISPASGSAAEDTTFPSLPSYAAETMVDSIVALTMAISSLNPGERADGKKIITALSQTNFTGVSGPVSFTPEGDRANPRYSVLNLPTRGKEWENVGFITPGAIGEGVNALDICWASIGCDQQEAPSDEYPVPPEKLQTWVIAVITTISLLVVALAAKYWRSHEKKKRLKTNISEMQKKMEAMKTIDTELLDLDKQVEEAKRRQASLILQRANLQEMPSTWSSSGETLVEVTPDDDQYWSIHNKLKETMSNAWISKVWRVQNTSLWTYYSFHKDRLTMIDIDHNERHVWHGTSSLDPSIIYNDQQDGFMMQFSGMGFWGRGIYFANNSSYSDSYSYKPSENTQSDRPRSNKGEREMFLAKLLVGNEIFMNRDESNSRAQECARLTVPPTDANSGLKYNTVTGETGGSQVWVVYENGRAYPDYLIRYYKGKRDPKRTPFETREEAVQRTKRYSNNPKTKDVLPEFKSIIAVPAPKGFVTWEYHDNGWKPYGNTAQDALETAYQSFVGTNNTGIYKVQVQGGEWVYEVDLKTFVQTNIEHSAHAKRDVRRNTSL
mmetsp:Transcript_18850/g.27339  ORF Transcript_18850/g.27339 Transcript_18850/m.27339 type:complete len:908 (+) Transcript_18850:1-2724(+)